MGVPRVLAAIAAFVLVTAFVPARLAGCGGAAWFDDDPDARADLAAAVDSWLGAELERGGFSTGSELFDGEWWFGTFQMAGLGFGQLASAREEHRERHLASMERAIDGMLDERVRSFDAERWGEDPLAVDAGHHAAYLGYLGVVLGLHRLLVPESRYAELHDRIATGLARHLGRSKLGLLETYPGEVYPVDNCSVLATLALHERATGTHHDGVVEAAVARIRRRWVDPDSGLLFQAVHAETGEPRDRPRGSGTALAAYFLSFADPPLSRQLASAVEAELRVAPLGFGLVREYPRSSPGGRGDVDSGPVVAGIGVSPTGFSIACARLLSDRGWFLQLHRTARLFGAPRGDRGFAVGGPLGNAIMLAMLTAKPLEPAS